MPSAPAKPPVAAQLAPRLVRCGPSYNACPTADRDDDAIEVTLLGNCSVGSTAMVFDRHLRGACHVIACRLISRVI